MEIWGWRIEWNAPRRIDFPDEKTLAGIAENESELFLFFAELVMS